MKIHIYQHSAGDLKVVWKNAAGMGEEHHFEFDLGGAISFALGLKVGALARAEKVELSSSFENPFRNRGFLEGFRRGCVIDPRELGDFTPHDAAPQCTFNPGDVSVFWGDVLKEALR